MRTKNKEIQMLRRQHKFFFSLSTGKANVQLMRQSRVLRGIDFIKITEEKESGIILASTQT